jgi:hypothetical protein
MKIKNEKPTRALPFGFSNENTIIFTMHKTNPRTKYVICPFTCAREILSSNSTSSSYNFARCFIPLLKVAI